MPLMSFVHCWRGRTDCTSFAAIEGIPPGTTEDQRYDLDFVPTSFVCCGCVKEADRKLPQDAYRVCFKNDTTDQISDNDEQDLAHLVQVISNAQAVIATRRVHQPTVRVLGDEDMIDVPSKQCAMMDERADCEES